MKSYNVYLDKKHIGTMAASSPEYAIETICRYKMLDSKALNGRLEAKPSKKTKK